jgi:hypothetical protein
MRLRPLAAAVNRRRAEPSWKDQARAALATPVAVEAAAVSSLRQPVAWETAAGYAEAAGKPIPPVRRHDWEWWQAVAPALIAIGAVAQLVMSMQW